jgi:hypothetical protein
MSVTRVGVMIVCDGPSEGEECPNAANWMDAVPTTALRSRMKREDGWQTALPGGQDRCAACASKARSLHASQRGTGSEAAALEV